MKTATRPARVLIVDDHPAVREALALRISGQSDLEVCGEAADMTDAIRLVNTENPDIAIVDIRLKTGNGIDLIKRIKARNENILVLVWSMYNDTLYAERALRAGASGYINKEEATDQIIKAIRQIQNGKLYLTGPISDRLLNRAVGAAEVEIDKDKDLVSVLSDRELEVFQLIGQGKTTREVAENMHVSPKTIETYRCRIKEKLNLRGPELVRTAIQWTIEQT